jgi:hypothetical protein
MLRKDIFMAFQQAAPASRNLNRREQMNRIPMKSLAVVALMLSVRAAGAYANDEKVKMSYSGTAASSAINLQQPNTTDDEDTFAGDGTLGAFTLRNIRAISNAPGASTTCSGSNKLFLTESAGAGVFRFKDGSLLELTLTEGSDCIDLTTGIANCLVTFKITGGTGRFKNASGNLTMTETVSNVISDTLGNPALSVGTGTITGEVHCVDKEEN